MFPVDLVLIARLDYLEIAHCVIFVLFRGKIDEDIYHLAREELVHGRPVLGGEYADRSVLLEEVEDTVDLVPIERGIPENVEVIDADGAHLRRFPVFPQPLSRLEDALELLEAVPRKLILPAPVSGDILGDKRGNGTLACTSCRHPSFSDICRSSGQARAFAGSGQKDSLRAW